MRPHCCLPLVLQLPLHAESRQVLKHLPDQRPQHWQPPILQHSAPQRPKEHLTTNLGPHTHQTLASKLSLRAEPRGMPSYSSSQRPHLSQILTLSVPTATAHHRAHTSTRYLTIGDTRFHRMPTESQAERHHLIKPRMPIFSLTTNTEHPAIAPVTQTSHPTLCWLMQGTPLWE